MWSDLKERFHTDERGRPRMEAQAGFSPKRRTQQKRRRVFGVQNQMFLGSTELGSGSLQSCCKKDGRLCKRCGSKLRLACKG
jgi:hypothetical protein